MCLQVLETICVMLVDDAVLNEVKEMYSEEDVLLVKEFATFALAVLLEYNLPQPSRVARPGTVWRTLFLLTHIIDMFLITYIKRWINC